MKDLNPAERTFNKTLLALAITSCITVGAINAQEDNDEYIPVGFTPEEIQEYYGERREALNLLGIKEDFPSAKVIKKAFRDFSLKNHPDKHPEDKEKYHVLMQQAGNAKEGLLDPHIDEKRRQQIEKTLRIMKNNPQAGSYWEGVSETGMDFFYDEDDGTPAPQNAYTEPTPTAANNATASVVPTTVPVTPIHSDVYMEEKRAAALDILNIENPHPSRDEILQAYERLSQKSESQGKARDYLLNPDNKPSEATPTKTSSQPTIAVTSTQTTTTEPTVTPTESTKPTGNSQSYSSRLYTSIFGNTSMPEDANRTTETVTPTATETVSKTTEAPTPSVTVSNTEAVTNSSTTATPTPTPTVSVDSTVTTPAVTPTPTPQTPPTVYGPKTEVETQVEKDSNLTKPVIASNSTPSYFSRVYTSLFGKISTPEDKEIQEDRAAQAKAEKEARQAEFERLSKNNPQGGSYQEGLEHTYQGKPLPQEETPEATRDENTSPVDGKETADKLKANNPQGGSYHVGVDHKYLGEPLENHAVYGPELDPKRKAALELLGLTENASPSEEEVKKAFREYTRTHHPDKCDDKQACTEAFYKATEAKNYLLGINQDEDDTVYTGEPVAQIAGPETSKEDEEAADKAKAEAEEAERKRQEQERLRREIEQATAINDTSKVGKQVKSMYAAGLAQAVTLQSTAAMSHHGIAMNSFHNTHMLASAQLEDLNTGEMLASAGEQTINKQLIQEGGLYSYGQIYGFKMDQGKVDNLAGFDANGYGLEVGVFKQFTSEWTFGLMIGMQKMSSSFKDSQGSMKASNLRIGPFASWNKDQWHFNTALTYGMTDMDSKRRDPLFNQEYKASPSAKEWTAYASLGYDINMDHVATGLVLTPNVEVLYINSSVDSFKEKGQGDMALKVASQNRTHMITRTGLQMSYLIPDTELPREFRFGVGYQKSMLDDSPIKAGYVDQGSMQQLKTGSYGKDAIYYNAGYSMILENNQNLHIDYFGSTGKSSQSHALALTYEMKF